MNAVSAHKILHAKCSNLNAYTIVRQSPWQSDPNLFIDVLSLFEFPKMAQMFQNHLAMEIDVPTKAYTTC
jgi:hypothetical protein